MIIREIKKSCDFTSSFGAIILLITALMASHVHAYRLAETHFVGNVGFKEISMTSIGKENNVKLLVEPASKALEISIGKAIELNYDLEKFFVVLTQKDDEGWEVYFKPRIKTQRGGGLTVHIDREGNIVRIQRWR